MAEIKLHVKLPIFVARQWIRHRTASVNEYSARYSILDREFYVPEPEHLAAQSHANRQGRENLLEGEEASFVLRLLREDAECSYEHYLTLLNQEQSGGQLDLTRLGLARELARMNLSVNFYTQWYWKVDLHRDEFICKGNRRAFNSALLVGKWDSKKLAYLGGSGKSYAIPLISRSLNLQLMRLSAQYYLRGELHECISNLSEELRSETSRP